MDKTFWKDFYSKLTNYFFETKKTGWGKHEIVSKIKDLYIEWLEEKEGKE